MIAVVASNVDQHNNIPSTQRLCTQRNVPVFKIACWTDAWDQQKQHWAGKAIVYAGPKDQQSALVLRNS